MMEENRSKRSNSPLFLINEPLGGIAELHLRKSNLNLLLVSESSLNQALGERSCHVGPLILFWFIWILLEKTQDAPLKQNWQ